MRLRFFVAVALMLAGIAPASFGQQMMYSPNGSGDGGIKSFLAPKDGVLVSTQVSFSVSKYRLRLAIPVHIESLDEQSVRVALEKHLSRVESELKGLKALPNSIRHSNPVISTVPAVPTVNNNSFPMPVAMPLQDVGNVVTFQVAPPISPDTGSKDEVDEDAIETPMKSIATLTVVADFAGPAKDTDFSQKRSALIKEVSKRDFSGSKIRAEFSDEQQDRINDLSIAARNTGMYMSVNQSPVQAAQVILIGTIDDEEFEKVVTAGVEIARKKGTVLAKASNRNLGRVTGVSSKVVASGISTQPGYYQLWLPPTEDNEFIADSPTNLMRTLMLEVVFDFI